MESQTRKDVRDSCSRILYEDETFLIGVDNRGYDAHNVLVNDAYAYLDRGILNELARSDGRRLKSSLEMVGQQVLREVQDKRIPLEELGWALAKAAIKDVEDYATHISSREEGV